MEKLNLNFNGRDNILKSICWLFSIISWLLYLITGWISLFDKKYNFWTIPKNTNNAYMPTQIEEACLYIIFIVTLVISTSAFCAYMFYSIYNKSNSVFNGMMEKIGRFHFIPLVCAVPYF